LGLLQVAGGIVIVLGIATGCGPLHCGGQPASAKPVEISV